MPAGKRLAFRLVAMALPLLAVGLFELGLRFAGYGGYPPMLQRVGPVRGGHLVIADQGGAASWFFATPSLAGRNEMHAFLDPKPTNTVRIFCVGASAMQGYPQPRNLAASAFLQAMLSDLWPGRRTEVINLGTTAIASFPVLGILTEALEYEPDLVIVYAGNNEFFGTYGVASAGRAGSKPWMLRVNRALHSLAVVQALDHWLQRGGHDLDRTLMETMMAQTYIGPGDWRRKAAAETLHSNLSEMLRRCRMRGVPALVCNLPANERDLAPLGQDKLDHLPPTVQNDVASLLNAGEKSVESGNYKAAADNLEALLRLFPQHARAHYLLGRCLAQQEKLPAALEHYLAARDWDTMPWRPPSALEDAIAAAAREAKVPVCDLIQAFRAASPGGAMGWELLDDHVHPTLRGQALIAECVVNSLTNYTGAVQISPVALAHLPAWTDYAQRLGENAYDRYAVAHSMRTLFNAQFMRANNPQAFERYNGIAVSLENQMPPAVRQVLQEWQETRPFAGSRCPVTAAVAQLQLKQDDYTHALENYEIALQGVPTYTSWRLEYTYYVLFCRQKLNGGLDSADRQRAREAISQGRFLTQYGKAANGFTERYTGLLLVLCGEFAEAIPFFAAGREKQTGLDRLIVDQSLVLCYLQTREFTKARALLNSAAHTAGEYREHYAALLSKLPLLEKAMLESPPTRPAADHN